MASVFGPTLNTSIIYTAQIYDTCKQAVQALLRDRVRNSSRKDSESVRQNEVAWASD